MLMLWFQSLKATNLIAAGRFDLRYDVLGIRMP
jgi:ABC-type antimicrobial peptide transport system permease subunit